MSDSKPPRPAPRRKRITTPPAQRYVVIGPESPPQRVKHIHGTVPGSGHFETMQITGDATGPQKAQTGATAMSKEPDILPTEPPPTPDARRRTAVFLGAGAMVCAGVALLVAWAVGWIP